MAGRFYVYLHKTRNNVPFYVGKGTGDRAWSLDRDPAWNHYVTNRLGGQFEVEIVANDLSEAQALDIEDDWMRRLGSTLINRQNFHRGLDMATLDRSNALRAKMIELTRLAELGETAADRARLYGMALSVYAEQSAIVFERGIFGDILKDMAQLGRFDLIKGRVDALIAMGELVAAETAIVDYDSRFPSQKDHKGLHVLRKRVTRLLNQGWKPTGPSAPVEPFEPPAVLPPDWEWAQENGIRVTRLLRSFRRPGVSYLDLLEPIRALKREEKNVEALAMLKSAMVAAEADRGSVAPFYTNDGAVVARKLGAPLEECLILNRYINHPRAVPAAVPAMIQRLGKATATLRKATKATER